MTNKEGSAVAALLGQINDLKERVDTLENWLGIGRPHRTAREVREYYGINEAVPEWIDTSVPIAENPIPIRNVGMSRDDTIYATTNDNITIPLTGINGHYGGTAYSASSHI